MPSKKGKAKPNWLPEHKCGDAGERIEYIGKTSTGRPLYACLKCGRVVVGDKMEV